MRWVLVSRRDRRRAAAWATSGFVSLILAGLAGGLAVPPGTVFWAGAGFVSFVLCLRWAMVLWRVDEMVFEHGWPGKARRTAPALRFPTAQETERSRQLSHV
jgi:hypothetical protein